MRKTLIIHAGYGKTGTSAIKATLQADSKRLQEHGFLYLGRHLRELRSYDPRLRGRVAGLGSLRGEAESELVQCIADALLRCGAERPATTFIWSNESLALRSPLINELRAALGDEFDVRAILFLRKQDAWFISSFTQWGVKSNRTGGPLPTFEEFFERTSDRGFYVRNIDRWVDALGRDKVLVESYRREGLVNDFYRLCGLPGEPPLDVAVNETPNTVVLSLFKIYNSQFDEPVLPRWVMPLLSKSGVLDMDFRPVDWSIGLPTTERCGQILEMYREHNRELKERYGVDLSDEPRMMKPELRPDTSEFVAALMQMILHLSDKVEELRTDVMALSGGELDERALRRARRRLRAKAARRADGSEGSSLSDAADKRGAAHEGGGWRAQLRRFAMKRLHYARATGLTYLNNPKVACSTIKTSLWLAESPTTFTGDPHRRRNSPFPSKADELAADLDRFLRSTFFSVTRNPYARALSGYLNKIVREHGENTDRENGVWVKFCRQYGLSPEDPPPRFGDFLRIIADDKPHDINPHFRPQHLNLLHPIAPMDFIGHLEDMDTVESFLRQRGVLMRTLAPRPTNAQNRIGEYFEPETIALVQRIYADDFALYGYALDPARQAPERPAVTTADKNAFGRLILDLVAPVGSLLESESWNG
jgi:hypothetical protein